MFRELSVGVVALLALTTALDRPAFAGNAQRKASATRTATGAAVSVSFTNVTPGRPAPPPVARPAPPPRPARHRAPTPTRHAPAPPPPPTSSLKTRLTPGTRPTSPGPSPTVRSFTGIIAALAGRPRPAAPVVFRPLIGLTGLGIHCVRGPSVSTCAGPGGINFSVPLRPPPVTRRPPPPRPSRATPPRIDSGQAQDLLVLPPPTIRMSPRAEWEQIVNLESWLWVDGTTWRPSSRRVEAGGEWAEVTGVPREVVWSMGNGDRVVCRGPGTAYDPGRPAESQRTDCSYTYRRSSAGQPGDRYTVSATTNWDVSWRASDGAGGNLGTVSRQSRVEVRVAELEALKP